MWQSGAVLNECSSSRTVCLAVHTLQRPSSLPGGRRPHMARRSAFISSTGQMNGPHTAAPQQLTGPNSGVECRATRQAINRSAGSSLWILSR